MPRRLLNLLTLLSLLLCVAACVLWWGGTNEADGSGDQFVFTAGGRLWWVMCGSSRLHVLTVGAWPGAERFRWVPTGGAAEVPALIFSGAGTSWHRLGVAVERDTVTTWLAPGGGPAPLATYLAEAGRAGINRASTPMPYAVRVPWWMLVMVLGALPLWRGASSFRRDRRRRRLAVRNCCLACGYDLTGDVSGVCPECGGSVR
jgi:hypothetical protein